MKYNSLRSPVLTIAFLLTICMAAMAQAPAQGNFSGVINDYTPGTTVSPVGPWQITGNWSLSLRGGFNHATFSATLTMVRSDYWVVLNPSSEDTPQDRTPHAHDITLTDGVVTPITGGFQVSGTANIAANGSPAGFSPAPLTIQITGGTSVPYSNIKLTFGSPADGHFGTYPLDGAVQMASGQ